MRHTSLTTSQAPTFVSNICKPPLLAAQGHKAAESPRGNKKVIPPSEDPPDAYDEAKELNNLITDGGSNV